jgi:hypothetical protein
MNIDDIERLEHFRMEFIEGHRKLADGVFETTYSNGECVVVNYGESPYTIAAVEVVPPRAYRVFGN